MKNFVYNTILQNAAKGKKMLAVLLDPDKCQGELLEKTIKILQNSSPDFIFVGGSTSGCSEDILQNLKDIPVPKVLFPGSPSQFSNKADALLFLSLISGRNSDYLIGEHVNSALKIKESGMETIPTGYILIGKENKSAVERVSKTLPISSSDIELCVKTALAGEMLGLKLTYLEAGSGAAESVPEQVISEVKNHLSHPLIVGGGIKTIEQIRKKFNAGADVVVIGNFFERNPEKISEFVETKKSL